MRYFDVMRALNRHVESIFDQSRKDHHWATDAGAGPKETVGSACVITFDFKPNCCHNGAWPKQK